MNADWDRQFIDRVHARDEAEMAAGHLTPTHLLAVLTKTAEATSVMPAEVLRAVRKQHRNEPEAVDLKPKADAYDWSAWPHPAQTQLAVVCELLAGSESGRLVNERTAWALKLQKEVERVTRQALVWQHDLQRRTDWAWSLERDLVARTAWAQDLENQLAARTAWTLTLAQELREHALALSQLRSEFEIRTAWAQQLDAELASRAASVETLHRELNTQAELIQALERQMRRPLVRMARRAAELAGGWNAVIRKVMRRCSPFRPGNASG